jgi:hypothetical protein
MTRRCIGPPWRNVAGFDPDALQAEPLERLQTKPQSLDGVDAGIGRNTNT